MLSFAERLLGVARLDGATFEEIEHDEHALGQAAIVVLLAGAATGVAQLPQGHLAGAIGGAVLATIGWAIWAGIVWLLGVRLLPEPDTKADAPELLRTLGFAALPGVVRIVGIVPMLAQLADVVAGLWTIAAMVIAVRQVCDYRGTGRAVLVCVLGWSAQVAVLVAAAALLAGTTKPVASPPAETQGVGAEGIVHPSDRVPPAAPAE